ncbi:CHAT domain-containing protein [Scytonema sp. NUACC21]
MMQGYDQYHNSQFVAALQSWQQSLKIYQELSMRQAEGVSLSNLGLAYEGIGNYTKAIEYHQQAFVIAKEIQDYKGEGNVLINLGNIYCDLGQYDRALSYYHQGLEIAQELQDISMRASVLGNLGNVYQIKGDFNHAIEYFQKSLVLAQQVNDTQEQANILNNLGYFFYLIGDYDQAVKYYELSWKLKQRIGDRRGEVHIVGRLGLVYSELENINQAIEHHQQGLAISREIKYRLGELDSLKNLGEALLKCGDFDAAQKHLYDAVNLGESLRSELGESEAQKISFFETQDLTYRILQKVLIAQNKIEEALEVCERGRSSVFVEFLVRKSPRLTESQSPVQSTQIEHIKQIARQQNATLVEYSIIYDEFRIKGKLQAKESELFIWLVQPKGTVIFRQVDLKSLWREDKTTLADFVAISRESIGVRERDAVRVRTITLKNTDNKRLQQLYDKLIQPIADCLPQDENERVIFIPHESLFLAPFSALQDAGGKYLIEQHTILIAPSIQILNLTRWQQQQVQMVAKKEALVVGNPKMPKVLLELGQPPQKLNPLPGAKREAEAIAKLLNTKALTGDQATKLAVIHRLSEARIVHLATHGMLEDLKGLDVPGAIALAPSEEDDGLLTAVEILSLKLNAELVVLSACDTGRGRLSGDGVLGLSRSLIAAGVPSVIVSLWAVPDTSTADLMIEFYQNLGRGFDKAQALRQAMLTIMKQHPDNPKSWAAFTLIGEATYERQYSSARLSAD